MEELHEALEIAVLDVLDGSPPGPLFASRVKRECGDVLRKRGLQGTIEVTQGGTHVRVLVKRGRRVETVVVTVG
ncbi:MAG: hypothetical protein H6737_22430 [Alphaproteobacteria bacterium]|nr:hypothetical protein [Alphaproteobacteria bacterium]